MITTASKRIALERLETKRPSHEYTELGHQYFDMTSAQLQRLMEDVGTVCTREEARDLLRGFVARGLLARISRSRKNRFWFRFVESDDDMTSEEAAARDEAIALGWGDFGLVPPKAGEMMTSDELRALIAEGE